jgi:hypothetical protein
MVNPLIFLTTIKVLLMHVKCIHDLCTLPLDIPSYVHHILVIFMLFDDYWGIIHKFPNFFGLTSENQKTSISMLLTFRDPNGVQMT